MNMANWLKTYKMINWPAVMKDNVFTDSDRQNHKKLKKGDTLTYFISGTRHFCGTFEAVSDWYELEYIWPDQSSSKFRIDLKPIQLGYAKFSTLFSKLEFCTGRELKKIGGLTINSNEQFANFNTEISDKDCKLIINELKNNQTPPEEYTKAEKQYSAKYWVIRTGVGGSDWPTQRDNGFAGISFTDFGTLSDYYDEDGILTSDNKQKIREKIGHDPSLQKYGEGSSREAAISQILISFNNLMKIKSKDGVVALDGIWKILGMGTAVGNYKYQSKFDYPHTVPVKWNDVKEIGLANSLNTPGTIFEISKQRFKELISKKSDLNTLVQTDEHSKMIVENLELNKQIILYGPPGTSKTFNAKKVAVEMLLGKQVNPEDIADKFKELQNQNKVDLVQFHPSYSYEDFVQGIKPVTKNGIISYEVRNGIFKKLCDQKYGDSKDLFANVTMHKEIHNPFKIDELDISLQQYGINKIKKNDFRKIVEKLYSKQNTDFGNNLDSFNDFFILRSHSNDNPYGDITGEKYHFTKGIPGSVQLLDGLKKGPVPFFYYDLDAGGIFGCGILEGYDEGEVNDIEKRVLIIDEINRGNLSKIFGELIYALEYRGEQIRLQYADFDDDKANDFLTVPKNLYLIGTMNTADRSVSLFDTAMRRRFAFVPMMVNYDLVANKLGINIEIPLIQEKYNENLKKSKNTHQKNSIRSLYAVYGINQKISKDLRMGREKQVGHTYLLKIIDKENQFLNVWKYQIIPLLEEFYSAKMNELKEILPENIFREEEGLQDFDENTLEKFLDSIIKKLN